MKPLQSPAQFLETLEQNQEPGMLQIVIDYLRSKCAMLLDAKIPTLTAKEKEELKIILKCFAKYPLEHYIEFVKHRFTEEINVLHLSQLEPYINSGLQFVLQQKARAYLMLKVAVDGLQAIQTINVGVGVGESENRSNSQVASQITPEEEREQQYLLRCQRDVLVGWQQLYSVNNFLPIVRAKIQEFAEQIVSTQGVYLQSIIRADDSMESLYADAYLLPDGRVFGVRRTTSFLTVGELCNLSLLSKQNLQKINEFQAQLAQDRDLEDGIK